MRADDDVSYEDSEQFEEDSVASLISDDAMANRWTDWKLDTSATTSAVSRFVKSNHKRSVPSLLTLSSQVVGQKIPFELVENYKKEIPPHCQKLISKYCFPLDESSIRLYSCLTTGTGEEFEKGEILYSEKSVKNSRQIGFRLTASVETKRLDGAPVGSYTTVLGMSVPGIVGGGGPAAMLTADYTYYKFDVAIAIDRHTITECVCTCAPSGFWCRHIVAVILCRIRSPNDFSYSLPISESLNNLNRVDLQKFAQFLIASLPPTKILPAAQDILDQLLSQEPNEVNQAPGGPDATSGGSIRDVPSWCIDDENVLENLNKILQKFIVPGPIVCCERNYHLNIPGPTQEYLSFLRPLRTREPEGIWNLISIIESLFKKQDNNALTLLKQLTKCLLQCDTIMVWWYSVRCNIPLPSRPAAASNGASQLSAGTLYANNGGSNYANNYKCHLSAADFCDEMVHLWYLASVRPNLTCEERLHYVEQLEHYHTMAISNAEKGIRRFVAQRVPLLPGGGGGSGGGGGGANGTVGNHFTLTTSNGDNRQEAWLRDMKNIKRNRFSGFLSPMQACRLVWDDMQLPKELLTDFLDVCQCPPALSTTVQAKTIIMTIPTSSSKRNPTTTTGGDESTDYSYGGDKLFARNKNGLTSLEILFGRCEGLFYHGYTREAIRLVQRLSECILSRQEALCQEGDDAVLLCQQLTRVMGHQYITVTHGSVEVTISSCGYSPTTDAEHHAGGRSNASSVTSSHNAAASPRSNHQHHHHSHQQQHHHHPPSSHHHHHHPPSRSRHIRGNGRGGGGGGGGPSLSGNSGNNSSMQHNVNSAMPFTGVLATWPKEKLRLLLQARDSVETVAKETSRLFSCILFLCRWLLEDYNNNNNAEVMMDECSQLILIFRLCFLCLTLPRPPSIDKALQVKLINQETDIITVMRRLGNQLPAPCLLLLRTQAVRMSHKVSHYLSSHIPYNLATFIYEKLSLPSRSVANAANAAQAAATAAANHADNNTLLPLTATTNRRRNASRMGMLNSNAVRSTAVPPTSAPSNATHSNNELMVEGESTAENGVNDPSNHQLGFEAAVACLGMKLPVLEKLFPMLVEGQRKQRDELAMFLCSQYSQEPLYLEKILDELLDRSFNPDFKAPRLSLCIELTPEELIRFHDDEEHTFPCSGVDVHDPGSSHSMSSAAFRSSHNKHSSSNNNNSRSTGGGSAANARHSNGYPDGGSASSSSTTVPTRSRGGLSGVGGGHATASLTNHSHYSQRARRFRRLRRSVGGGSSGGANGAAATAARSGSPLHGGGGAVVVRDGGSLLGEEASFLATFSTTTTTMPPVGLSDSGCMGGSSGGGALLLQRMATIDNSAPETTSSDNSPTMLRRRYEATASLLAEVNARNAAFSQQQLVESSGSSSGADSGALSATGPATEVRSSSLDMITAAVTQGGHQNNEKEEQQEEDEEDEEGNRPASVIMRQVSSSHDLTSYSSSLASSNNNLEWMSRVSTSLLDVAEKENNSFPGSKDVFNKENSTSHHPPPPPHQHPSVLSCAMFLKKLSFKHEEMPTPVRYPPLLPRSKTLDYALEQRLLKLQNNTNSISTSTERRTSSNAATLCRNATSLDDSALTLEDEVDDLVEDCDEEEEEEEEEFIEEEDERLNVTNSMAYHMYELGDKIIHEAGGGDTRGTMHFHPWGAPNANGMGGHHAFVNSTAAVQSNRNLQLCGFMVCLYSLGLFNQVSPNWQSRAYSGPGNGIASRVTEIGVKAACILLLTWRKHFTPSEVAQIADKASKLNDRQMSHVAAELCLSFLSESSILKPQEILRSLEQCKEQSNSMLEKALNLVELGAESSISNILPEVFFHLAKNWHELSVNTSLRDGLNRSANGSVRSSQPSNPLPPNLNNSHITPSNSLTPTWPANTSIPPYYPVSLMMNNNSGYPIIPCTALPPPGYPNIPLTTIAGGFTVGGPPFTAGPILPYPPPPMQPSSLLGGLGSDCMVGSSGGALQPPPAPASSLTGSLTSLPLSSATSSRHHSGPGQTEDPLNCSTSSLQPAANHQHHSSSSSTTPNSSRGNHSSHTPQSGGRGTPLLPRSAHEMLLKSLNCCQNALSILTRTQTRQELVHLNCSSMAGYCNASSTATSMNYHCNGLNGSSVGANGNMNASFSTHRSEYFADIEWGLQMVAMKLGVSEIIEYCNKLLQCLPYPEEIKILTCHLLDYFETRPLPDLPKRALLAQGDSCEPTPFDLDEVLNLLNQNASTAGMYDQSNNGSTGRMHHHHHNRRHNHRYNAPPPPTAQPAASHNSVPAPVAQPPNAQHAYSIPPGWNTSAHALPPPGMYAHHHHHPVTNGNNIPAQQPQQQQQQQFMLSHLMANAILNGTNMPPSASVNTTLSPNVPTAGNMYPTSMTTAMSPPGYYMSPTGGPPPMNGGMAPSLTSAALHPYHHQQQQHHHHQQQQLPNALTLLEKSPITRSVVDLIYRMRNRIHSLYRSRLETRLVHIIEREYNEFVTEIVNLYNAVHCLPATEPSLSFSRIIMKIRQHQKCNEKLRNMIYAGLKVVQAGKIGNENHHRSTATNGNALYRS